MWCFSRSKLFRLLYIFFLFKENSVCVFHFLSVSVQWYYLPVGCSVYQLKPLKSHWDRNKHIRPKNRLKKHKSLQSFPSCHLSHLNCDKSTICWINTTYMITTKSLTFHFHSSPHSFLFFIPLLVVPNCNAVILSLALSSSCAPGCWTELLLNIHKEGKGGKLMRRAKNLSHSQKKK